MTAPTITSAARTVDERVGVTFAKRANRADHTHWLEISYPVDAKPEVMLAELAAAGWASDGMKTVVMPAGEARDGRWVNLGYDETDVYLMSPGSGLFSGWTADEKREKVTAARTVMRRFGFTRVPVWNKTLQDML